MKRLYNSKIIALTLALLAACLGLHAQSPLFFATENGLSSSLINRVCYTSDGNLWVATEDGLNRYDGSKITIYKNVPDDSTSIAHNFVNYVFEDTKGHIFVSTHNGLQMYDPARDAFTQRARGDDGNIYGNPVSAIVERHNGDLWAFGQEIRQITFDADSNMVIKNLNLPSDLIGANVAIETPDGCLWCANDIKGVYRIMPNN
ncbi:MAG: hybrid sensor histidine kinase/response regulator, partial [Muribaculaceae bacterium]|nr:hybrid sensor histidine kinase/response regulator [Muribaculaceae bacterium]